MRIRRRWGVIIGCAAAFSLVGCDGGEESAESGGSDIVGTENGDGEQPVAGTACETPGEGVCFDSTGGVLCSGGSTWQTFSVGQQEEGSDCWSEYTCFETPETGGFEFVYGPSVCIGFAGVSVAGRDRTIHRSLRTV